MGVQLVLAPARPFRASLDLERRLARRQAGAVADAEDVRVDRDVGSPKAMLSTTLAVLRPTPGSASSASRVARHLAAVLVDQLARQRDDVLGLGAKSPIVLIASRTLVFAERDHLLAACRRRRTAPRVALLTPASVACADSTTATSSVYGLMCCSSPFGSGSAARKRRNASSISAGRPAVLAACRLRLARLRPAALAAPCSAPGLSCGLCGPCFRVYLRPTSPGERHDLGQREPDHLFGDAHAAPLAERAGFLVVMLVVGAISFVAGMVFLLIGAWPVVGFLGLDVLLIYWALPANYRGAARLRAGDGDRRASCACARSATAARCAEWTLNPGVGASSIARPTRSSALSGCSWCRTGRRLAIAGFLGPAEKESFAAARWRPRSARPGAGRPRTVLP